MGMEDEIYLDCPLSIKKCSNQKWKIIVTSDVHRKNVGGGGAFENKLLKSRKFF